MLSFSLQKDNQLSMKNNRRNANHLYETLKKNLKAKYITGQKLNANLHFLYIFLLFEFWHLSIYNLSYHLNELTMDNSFFNILK